MLDVLADEDERDTPVPADVDGPSSLSVPPELVQIQSRQTHVGWTSRDAKAAKYEPESAGVLGLDSGFGARCKETLQALVSKSLNRHKRIVTYYVT